MSRKIILSRKGFDSSNGGMPSPILPDGTLLSLPIPFTEETQLYDELFYKDQSYKDIILELNPRFRDQRCHLDPDIYKNIVKVRDKEWNACFGQSHAAQTHLENSGVDVGDIFLFFGWYKQTEFVNNKLKFVRGAPDLQVIFGYLEVGEKCTSDKDIDKLVWHPHSKGPSRFYRPNAIYTATKFLMNTNLPGYGTFKISKDLILTKEGLSRAKWNLPNVFRGKPMTYHSDKSQKEDYFQSAMIGQEFVVESDSEITSWVLDIIKRHIVEKQKLDT